MWFAGFSLDNLSLMALTIGTGFVVDDAIVMIENIVRHIEDGEPPLEAALRGARQIGFTVISLTMSLVAVFIPLLFMTGLVGRMFREFALTLTIAVVVSAIVSLTLTPMMCGRLLRAGEERRGNRLTRGFAAVVDGSVDFYRRTPALGAAPSGRNAHGHARHARRHRGALRHDAEGLPALAGHRHDHGGDRGRHRRLLRRDAAAPAHGGRRGARRSGCRQRRLGDRREPAQQHAQCRPAHHRAQAHATSAPRMSIPSWRG